MARLVLEAFHRRELPGDLRSDRAMRLYLEQVIVEAGHAGGGFPARRRVLMHLVRELDKAGADVLPRDTLLASSVKELRDALLNPQRDSAYVQLLELGVLLEEWDGDTCHVRFAFDRLFEFLLAELHDPRVQDVEGAITLAARAVGFKSLRGALEAILGRACEQGRDGLLSEIIDRSGTHEDARVRELLRDVAATLLERLAREQDPAFGRLLDVMPREPSAGDVDVLVLVADRLELLGEAKALDALLVTLVAEATALGELGSLGRALLRQGRRLDVRGDWEQAIECFEMAARSAREADDPSTQGWAGLLAANLRGRRGDAARAEAEMRAVLDGFIGSGDRAGSAEVSRRLGILAKNRGDMAEADRLYRASLGMQQELGNKRGIASCLHNLGVLAKNRGDLDEAERLCKASLAIIEQFGDKARMAQSLNNLGSLAMYRGELAEAERLYQASLSIKTELGDKAGVASSLYNMAIIAQGCGDLVRADERLNDSLAIFRSLGEKACTQESAYLLGMIRSLRDDAAGTLLEEACALGETLGTPSARRYAMQARLVLLLGSEVAVPHAVKSALEELREARRAQSDRPDPEEGPATPYLLAARWFRDRGLAEEASALAREALDEVGDGLWPYRTEAEALLN